MGACVSVEAPPYPDNPAPGELGVIVKRFPSVPGEDAPAPRRKARRPPPPRLLPASQRVDIFNDPLVKALQRRVDAHANKDDPAAAALRAALALPLPSRATGALALAAAVAPDAPAQLFKALHVAVLAGNCKWATSTPDVALLLSDEIVFTDLRGETTQGKEAVLVAMNEAVERLLKRISGSTRSGKSGELKTNHMKLSSSPLTSLGQGTWSSVISFRCARRPPSLIRPGFVSLHLRAGPATPGSI